MEHLNVEPASENAESGLTQNKHFFDNIVIHVSKHDSGTQDFYEDIEPYFHNYTVTLFLFSIN